MRVLRHKRVVDGPPASRAVAECLVADATGCVVLSARGAEQVAAATASGEGGAPVVLRLRRARVDMYRGSMRLCVAAGDGGTLERVTGEEAAAAALGAVDENNNNVSLLEFELVQADGVPLRTVDAVREQAARGAEAAAAAAAARPKGGKKAAAAAAAAEGEEGEAPADAAAAPDGGGGEGDDE